MGTQPQWRRSPGSEDTMKPKPKRRKNQAGMSTAAKVAIVASGSLGLGALGAWLFANTEPARTIVDNTLDVIDETDVRMPQPSMKMMLAETPEEFDTLDEIICELGAPLVNDAPPGTTADEVIEDLRNGMARELYPDFPWPPMAGDHPSVGQLWTELGVLSRRAVVTGMICPEGEV